MESGQSDITTTMVQKNPVFADRFRIVRVLGEGAAGAVLHVVDQSQGNREVALKILRNDAAFDDKTFERFIEERNVCKDIRHPNVVEAYDLIKSEGMVGFTMEYVPGADLARLSHARKLTCTEIDSIFTQALAGLEELHRRGVVHRDMKMENILVRHDGLAKIGDLGLVKRADTKRTATGVLLGTAQYFPPEYIRSSTYDSRGDLYAVGLSLWEVLSGERWLSKKNGAEAIQHLLKTKFKVPRLTDPEIPEKYHLILECALDPNPENRFSSALDMRAAFLDPRTIKSKHISRSPTASVNGGPKILDALPATKKSESNRWKVLVALVTVAAVLVAMYLAL